MPAVKALKSSEKSTILKKLVTELKKRYGGKTPKHSHPVLETVLYAACLEDTDHEAATTAFELLKSEFFDLNEVRVSSVTEIEEVFGDLHEAAWKSMRVRETLQHTFEKYFAFDLELLKRKTQDAATKELKEIPFQTLFMRNYTLQNGLGSHVLPIDERMLQVLRWLGLAEENANAEATSDDLKSAVKKSDGPLVCALLKEVSVDPELRWAFEEGPDPEEEIDPHDAPKRLADLFKNPNPKPKKKAKKATKKSATKTSTTKKSTTKKTTKKKATTKSKSVAKKKPAKKTSPKRTTVKKKSTAKKVAKKVTKKKTKRPAAKKKTTKKK